MSKNLSKLNISEPKLDWDALAKQVGDYELRSIFCWDNETENVSNALVFSFNRLIYKIDVQEKNYKNCLIIQGNRIHSMPDTDENNNVYIYVSSVPRTVDRIITVDYLNECTTLDENRMMYQKNPGKGLFSERVILSDPACKPQVGRNCLIGINENIIYDEINPPTHKIFTSVGGVFIGKNVVIGNNVTIYRGLTEATLIDDDVIIPDNVIIHHDCHITNRVKLQSFNEYWART